MRPKLEEIEAKSVNAPVGVVEALEKLLAAPDLCSKRWAWEQDDHVILGNTVQRLAAMLRWCASRRTERTCVTTDVTPRYCEADPFEGGKQAVAKVVHHRRRRQAARELYNLNSESGASGDQGHPRHRGSQLNFPVVSGYVSLYNEPPC